MDDFWSIEVWRRLMRSLPDDENGSRVILTTRLVDVGHVATYAEDCSPHEMRLMHEDQSWDLLRQKVFTEGVCDCNLEAIGMGIARSCGGLPLAIVVIAGLLSTVDRIRASWEEIAERVNSIVAAKDGHFEKILSLSYTDLPRHLRQCFVYMGGFSEDSKIHVAKLIKLWIAEGFIGVMKVSRSLEDEGEECLNDLIKRNLVLVGRRKPHGKIKSCRLHDLVLAYNVEIPAAVSHLQNLQTFIIYAMEGLVHLPPEIWTMPQLRHIVSSFDQLPFPKGVSSSCLESLQTLSEVNNLECTDRSVEMIPNIKTLELSYSTCYEFHQEYHQHDFFSLHQRGYPNSPQHSGHTEI